MNKQLLVIFIGRVLQAVVTLASFRIMTSVLPSQEVGNHYLIMAVFGYFSLILINPVHMFFNRQLHSLHLEGHLQDFFRVLNIYFFGVTFLTVPILYVVHSFFNVGANIILIQFMILVVVNTYGSAWFNTLCPGLIMLGRTTAFVTITTLSQLIGFGIAVLVVNRVESSAFYWLSGSLLGQVIGAIISYVYFKKYLIIEKSAALNWRLLFNKQTLLFAYPVALTTLFMWIQMQSYRVLVEKYIGVEELAYIGVGLSVSAGFFGLAESIVTQYLMPRFYSVISTGNQEVRAFAWNKQYKASLIVYLLLMVLIIVLAKPIINLLIHEKFSNVISLVRWGALFEFFRVITNSIYSISHSELKTSKSIKPYMLGSFVAVISVISVIHFAPEMIIQLIPVALVLGSFVCMIAMYFEMNKMIKIHFLGNTVFKVLALSAPTLGFIFIFDQITGIWESILAGTGTGVLFVIIAYSLKGEFK